MSPVFADTSFYIALLNPLDALHHRALSAIKLHPGRRVTTEYVLVEVGNYFSARNRSLFIRLLDVVRHDPETEIIAGSNDLFEQGASLYAKRKDKMWSLTDCISMKAMEARGVSAVLSSDHHFEQAGLKLLIQR